VFESVQVCISKFYHFLTLIVYQPNKKPGKLPGLANLGSLFVG